jgi:hypothetical protein
MSKKKKPQRLEELVELYLARNLDSLHKGHELDK